MRYFLMLIGLFYMVAAPASFADNKTILHHVPAAEKVGHGRLTVLLWNVYDATLYAPNKQYNASKPYALSLAYLLELKGADIAERSVEEMRKQGFKNDEKLSEWQRAMEGIFPDIKEGNVLTGIRDANGVTLFYLDDRRIGSIKDPQFSEHFFAIWLGENTSEPELRKKIMGLHR
jgi:hypothetical protein